MARGFLAGALWGGVVAIGVAGVASVLIPLPQERRSALTLPVVGDEASADVQAKSDVEDTAAVQQPDDAKKAEAAPQAEAQADPEDPQTPVETARRPAAEAPVVPVEAPRVDVSEEEEVAPQEAGELTAAPRPDAETKDLALVDPPAEQAVAQPLLSDGAPRVEALDSPRLEAPQIEDELSISTDPVQPKAPEVPQDDTGLVQRDTVAEDPVEGAEDGAGAKLPQVADAQEETADGAEDLRPTIGKPATRLVARAEDAPEEPQAEAPKEAVQGAARPLEQFAAPVAAAQDKPRMAIVLIDDGKGPLGAEAIEAFPFPVSLAVQADAADAAERTAKYRSRGFEVLAMLDVPLGATASDAEVAVSAALDAVPDAIGLIEGGETGLQGSRDVSAQVTQALLASGHGLVMLPNGLNTAQALAARDGVPSVTVFRDFDGEGQDNRVKRRFLDQAAFKARQDGHVVMLGRMSADTISALLLWGLQDRASSVALVPVSAILLAPSPE